MDFVLGPPVYVRNGSTKVRLADDARKCVVFIGQLAKDNDNALDPNRTATGFFLFSDLDGIGSYYLVTNKHVALTCGEAPFHIRFNHKDSEESFLHLVEEADWAFHGDDTVDLAILEFQPPTEADVLAFPAKHILDPPRTEAKRIGPGDITYVVGLFKRLPGTNRSLPVVHTGHLALLSEGNERVKSLDWDQPLDKEARKDIKAHLVQAHTLSGASGSPVFIKRGIKTLPVEETGVWPKAYGAVFLLGVWQGSFEARPNDVLAAETGSENDRVSIGLGNVVPGHQVTEILRGEKLSVLRVKRASKKAAKEPAAKPDLTLYTPEIGVVRAELSAAPLDPEQLQKWIVEIQKVKRED